MGGSLSSQALKQADSLLNELSGTSCIQYADDFWRDLFTCFNKQPSLICMPPDEVDGWLRPHCEQLLVCNPMSHNFQVLLLHCVSMMSDTSTTSNHRAICNGLHLVGAVIKVAADTGNGSSLLTSLFDSSPSLPLPDHLLQSGSDQLLRLLVRSCQSKLVNVKARGPGYLVLVEVMHVLLLLLAATQLGALHVRGPPGTHPGLEALCGCQKLAPQVVSKLLQLCITRPPPPPDMAHMVAQAKQTKSSTLSSVAYAASVLLWLPVTAIASVVRGAASVTAKSSPASSPAILKAGLTPGHSLSPSPIADLSTLLLLLLLHAPDQPPAAFNPYRWSLQGLVDMPLPVEPDDEEQQRAGGSAGGQQPSDSVSINTQAPLMPRHSGTLITTSDPHATTSYQGLYDCISRALAAPSVMQPAAAPAGSGSSGGAAGAGADAGTGSGGGAGGEGEEGGGGTTTAWSLGEGLVSSGAEEAVLLLYTLAVGCPAFKSFLVSHPNPSHLVVPLMKVLYTASPLQQPHLMFMIQIVVLLLSQDVGWCHTIHGVMIQHGLPWCKEQLGKGVTLGSLVMVVLLRTVSVTWKLTSNELASPANAMAALANLAPYCAQLHARAAQRLMALLHALAKRYTRLGGVSDGPVALTAALAGAAATLPAQTASHLSVVEEYLRLVLEVINSCLTGPGDGRAVGQTAAQQQGEVSQHGQLAANLELLYALLHQQEVVMPLTEHPRLGDLASNLQVFIEFFNYRLDEALRVESSAVQAPDSSSLPLTNPSPSLVQSGVSWRSTEQVLRVLAATLPQWRPDRIKVFPQLRFTYEEEAEPDVFFVPYVWNLVLQRCGSVSWDEGQLVSALQQQHQNLDGAIA